MSNDRWLEFYDAEQNKLNLSSQKLWDEDIGDLCEFIEEHQVKNVDLSDNWLTSDAALLLAETTIEKLNLSHNSICPKGAAALANSSLLELDLSRNQIADKGAISLAKNQTIRILNISFNGIGDKGAEELANNTTLRSLNLQKNFVYKAGKLFASHPTLLYLNLSKNLLTNDELEPYLNNTRLLGFTAADTLGVDISLLDKINDRIERNQRLTPQEVEAVTMVAQLGRQIELLPTEILFKISCFATQTSDKNSIKVQSILRVLSLFPENKEGIENQNADALSTIQRENRLAG